MLLDFSLSDDMWRDYERQIHRLPLLQSFHYGQAVTSYYGHACHYMALRSDGGEVIGLCRMTERSALRGLLQAVMCDQGPVWLAGHDTAENFEAFVQAFAGQYPARIGRKRRFIPGYAGAGAHDILLQSGFRKVGGGYETIWLDLTLDEAALRQNLKKNWRGSLQKSERSGVVFEWDEQGRHLPWLLKYYALDKTRRGYDGPAPSFLRHLAGHFGAHQGLWIGRALYDSRCIGSVMIFLHGRAATYQVGWTADEGRRHGAQHGLLWDAVLRLKDRGFLDFDLGGMNNASAKGVGSFKAGMGGEVVRLGGLYS